MEEIDSKAGLNIGRATNLRGTLKVYLGMCAGVGKTYAMLSDALLLKQNGKNIVAGYIEPHMRPATAELAAQLPTIPCKTIEYKGLNLREFDIDAALELRPEIILVDELAHTNTPGSRHNKRWQDIEELLSQGINVCSTVNVQHIESLKDIVTQLTGVEIYETVPDSFLAKVDNFELIDIPPDELLSRLEEGKIYSREKVTKALTNFFRKENLVALREIVLRHTANAVDVQLRNLTTQKNKRLGSSNMSVMVAVPPNKVAQKLVRSSARLANQLKSPLLAVTVESPKTFGLSDEQQSYLDKALALADRIGADTVRAAGSDIAVELLNVARQRRVGIIVVGKPSRGRFSTYIFGSLVDELIRKSGEIDIQVVYGDKEESAPVPILPKTGSLTWKSVVLTILSVAATATLCLPLKNGIDPVNLGMLFLVPITWVALSLGRYEAGLAAILAVLTFDFLFVPPFGSFAVSDIQYLVTFAVMLFISLIISTLTLRVKAQSESSAEREKRTSYLLSLSKRLSECNSKESVAIVTREIIADVLDVEVAIYYPAENFDLKALNKTIISVELEQQELTVAQWVSRHKVAAGKGTDTLPASKGYYIPLEYKSLYVPVLAVYPPKRNLSLREKDLLDDFSHLISSALNKIDLQENAAESTLKVQKEELRNILLSSVSHDLRTPLTTIGAAADIIELEPALPQKIKQLAAEISESASYLTKIVQNVLDLTRLQSNELALKRDWHSFDELLEISMRRVASSMKDRVIKRKISENLPLLWVDGTLFEQVIVNILENIVRYTPNSAIVEIEASYSKDDIILNFADDGPGLPKDTDVFEKLVRGENSVGIGLGLAVCSAVVSAHKGRIFAENREPHGCMISISLPMPNQPEAPRNE